MPKRSARLRFVRRQSDSQGILITHIAASCYIQAHGYRLVEVDAMDYEAIREDRSRT